MAVSNDGKLSRQKNGEIVMQALQNLSEPATFTDVVKHIANKQNVKVSLIKDPVKSVLEKGVEYGFIQKHGARYAADTPVHVDSADVGEKSPTDKCVKYRRTLPPCCRRRYRCMHRKCSTFATRARRKCRRKKY